jgi:hypothetical protein
MKFIYSFFLFLAIGTIHSQSIQSPSKSITLSFNLADEREAQLFGNL